MLISVDLFTRSYRADFNVDSTGAHMKLLPESEKELKQYLEVVLPHYTDLPDGDHDLNTLVRLANQWQKANPNEKLIEPLTRLPYEIPKETKDMLERLAKSKDISMSQLLVQIIDKAYEKVVNNDVKGKD